MRPAVAFDIDHTLLIDNKLERVAFLRLLEFVVRDGGHALGSLADETAHVDELLVEQRAGAFSIETAVRRFVSQRGVTASDSYVLRYESMALEMVDQFVVPAPDARSTLDALEERGYSLAILSNGWNPLQQRKADRLEFKGPVLASADLGFQKPDRKAFAALVGRLGVDPGDVWYVGDDPRVDVAGAAAAGLHAVWIDAEDVKYPPALPPPPNVVGTLAELLTLLPDPVQV
jgi:putative hydrolase of the HAD superfamily